MQFNPPLQYFFVENLELPKFAKIIFSQGKNCLTVCLFDRYYLQIVWDCHHCNTQNCSLYCVDTDSTSIFMSKLMA